MKYGLGTNVRLYDMGNKRWCMVHYPLADPNDRGPMIVYAQNANSSHNLAKTQ